MPTRTASSVIPAAFAISSGIQRRPALSSATWADLLPMVRLSRVLCAPSFGNAANVAKSSSNFLGGITRRQIPSEYFGQTMTVNSVPSSAGRHIAGTWTRRFGSTPNRKVELYTDAVVALLGIRLQNRVFHRKNLLPAILNTMSH